jgi:sterol desaturase/sphingolipid hydroxylase (fatty acid hydroxylase superfamily)
MHKTSRLVDPKLDHLKSHGAHHRGENEDEFVNAPLADCVLMTSPVLISLGAWGLAIGPVSDVAIPIATLLAWSCIYAYLWTRIHRAIHGIETNWFGRSGCLFRFFRQHHLKHHANSGVNFGAVFPWTDYLFFTWGVRKTAGIPPSETG